MSLSHLEILSPAIGTTLPVVSEGDVPDCRTNKPVEEGGVILAQTGEKMPLKAYIFHAGT